MKKILKTLASAMAIYLNSAYAIDTNKEEVEALKQIMLPVQAQVQQALKANGKLQKSFDSYLHVGDSILSNAKLPMKEKSRRIKILNQKQFPDLELLLKEAKVDRRMMEKKVGNTFLALSAKYKRKYDWRMDEGLAIHWRGQHSENQSSPPPISNTQVLQAPFDNRNTSAVGVERDVDLDEGEYSTFTQSMFFGSNAERNGIGHFFQPTSSFNRIKVTGAVQNAEVHLFAIGIIGGSSSSAHSSVRIHKDGEVICEKKFEHGSVFAVVGWISEDNHGDQFSISCKVRNTSNGDELNTTFTTKTEASSAASVGAITAVHTTMRKIEIKMFNE